MTQTACPKHESCDVVIVGRIRTIPGLMLDPPGGAFYALIGCSALIGETASSADVIRDDIQLTQYLLEEGKMAAVPGSAYDLSPFFRISSSAADDKLCDAMDRISIGVSKLTTSKSAEHVA